jgi:hypothetical protein
MNSVILSGTLALFSLSAVKAADYNASTHGNDANPGTLSSPVRTLAS